MKTHEQTLNKKKKDKDGNVTTVTACNENAYIVDKDKIRSEGTGLSPKAKILME